MFGLGKKDAQGNQKRIEHRGKHVRASRTGGASVRAQKKVGGVTLTANSKHGIRASKKIAPGTRVAFQRGRFQLLGRWSKGPFNFNLSKSGASVSAKNRRGSFNFSNPRRSSFKMAGMQFRGQKAAQFQVIYMVYRLTVLLLTLALWLLALPFVLFIELLRLVFGRKRGTPDGEPG